MRSPADALKDPKPGDVVRHINCVIPDPGPSLTVEATVGNLVAFTNELAREIYWVTRDRWCDQRATTLRWEVLHVAP
jgi:hypothetical protein